MGLKIYDGTDLLEIEYEDLLKYHGHNMIGGVALAYKIMEFAFPILTDPDNPIPKRGTFSFYSGIGTGGLGVIDSVEMVLRVMDKGTLMLDPLKLENVDAPLTPGGKGKYYFEIGYGQKKICLALKDGLIADDFYKYSELCAKKKAENKELSAFEKEALRKARHDLAEAVMKTDAKDLFNLV